MCRNRTRKNLSTSENATRAHAFPGFYLLPRVPWPVAINMQRGTPMKTNPKRKRGSEKAGFRCSFSRLRFGLVLQLDRDGPCFFPGAVTAHGVCLLLRADRRAGLGRGARRASKSSRHIPCAATIPGKTSPLRRTQPARTLSEILCLFPEFCLFPGAVTAHGVCLLFRADRRAGLGRGARRALECPTVGNYKYSSISS